MNRSDKIASDWVAGIPLPCPAVGRHRSGRVHLRAMDCSRGAAMCGATMPDDRVSWSSDTVLGHGEAWCYSCIGNALEILEGNIFLAAR